MARNAERKAIRSKIDMFTRLARCFQEITHREEVARKGFAVGRNLSLYDSGERVGRLALRTMKKWDKERKLQRTMNIQTKLINMATEGKLGPNAKCPGCQMIPDSRLRQCGRCHKAYYCKIECQKKSLRQHRTECRDDGSSRRREAK